MARRKVFSNEKRNPSRLLGIERRELSFPEIEKGIGRGPIFKRLERFIPSPVRRLAKKLRPAHLVFIASVVVLALILAWLFGSVLPSPVSSVSPAPGSFVNSRKLSISLSLKRNVKPEDFDLEVDNKNVTSAASFKARSVRYTAQFDDGKHVVRASIRGGVLIRKRVVRWEFTVDTVPPDLKILSKRIKGVDGGSRIRVSFSGKTERGCEVSAQGKMIKPGADGKFRGEIEISRDESLRITSKDSAGNLSQAYIVTQEPRKARGIHVSIYAAGNDSTLKEILDLVESTELNCVQLDLKNEQGTIGTRIDSEAASELGTFSVQYDLENVIDMLRYRNIYTICRIVLFKDPSLAKKRSDLAVRDKYGGLWGKGLWVDPYSRDVWKYNISLAEAAAKAGFHEIQFDYVRFPSDGDTTRCVFPHQDSRTQREVISGFVSHARERLAKYNVFVSVDLFGLTASHQAEMGIGQKVEDIAKHVDYISPMLYPSHYNRGEYGLENPEENPFDTVYFSLRDFKKKLRKTTARLRPWLQDFSLRVKYTSVEVRSQIEACRKAGVDEWLLWNPNSQYTRSALKAVGET